MNISQSLLPLQLIQDTSKVLLTSFGAFLWSWGLFGLWLFPDRSRTIFRSLSGRASTGRVTILSLLFLSLQLEETVEDFELLREDEGLKKLGLRVLSAEAI
jgi:hypothetical protein